MAIKLEGIGSSEGIAIAKVFKLVEPEIIIPDKKITDAVKELKLFNLSVQKTKKDLINLEKISMEKLGSEKAAIFGAHQQILEDPEMQKQVTDLVNNEKINCAKALEQVSKQFQAMFTSMNDPYFKERASDIKDVTNRLLKYILNLEVLDLATISEQVVIIADDLTPSQTAQLNPEFVKGFACDMGGRTSHAAIMARTLEIPAVLGLKTIVKNSKHNQSILMNGKTGEIILDPSKSEIDSWTKQKELFLKEQKELLSFKEKSTHSKDGVKFELEANIGSLKDVDAVLENGGEGVGLFRTEFLYMDSDHFPTEEEQFGAYKAIIEKMGNKKVIIRTLDIGGDKKLSYFQFPEELNPFLGYRAIRLCLDKKDIFRTQLRALIRASVFGKIGIMFPMIATVDEFKSAKKIYEEEKNKLIKEGVKISDEIEVGMMMEIPAAAVIADKFAKYADFFSIGTNDLIQYNMAADRMSQFVSYLYQPFNPSILNMINLIIKGAHKHGKWVGMCGEMAGDQYAIPLLMGLELDYFSMSATSILKARKIISELNVSDMKELVQKALNSETNDEVLNLVKKIYN
ncbi:phosphoenolpyruvate--protein phosphotransferase [Spiroplasma endosymbiont of Amphibalanus improvisus]|uniref:phosphoenolpyruvate--protein phosphotransferase n=1 Tax=Spiroplasma endosymbiont of Amphibalanus improvisus TaxID=3066327 RepID=UPI00313E698C